MRTRPRLILALVVPVALIVSACSSAGASSAPSAEAPATAPSAASSAAPAEEAVTALALADDDLGRILTDGAGMVLYGFTPDTDGTPTCYDDCAVAWPPVVGGDTAGITVAEGLDGSKLTTVERTDGVRQLVYGDWPLYYFASDTAPGDTKGQGLNGVWFVIGADGTLIEGAGEVEYRY